MPSDETIPFDGWDQVALAAEFIFSTGAELFETEVMANARDVLAICRNVSPVPDGAARGYWPTLCLFWSEFKFELEVCADHIEVYLTDKPELNIWYEQHAPGQEFSEKFLAALPKVSGGPRSA